MSFDTSRYTFDPTKNYSGVVMEQGRVQLDSDWNAWLAQLSRRIQAGTLDTMGRAVYPPTTPFAFLISFDAAGNLTIGPGRMYVDGILAENHGDPTAAIWDSALAEKSNTPQPPPTTETGAIPFTSQPWFPTAALPIDPTTPYLAYLDVWQRAVTYIEDPDLIDPAVGIDTTGRLQTIWQVRLTPVNAGSTCASAGAPWLAASGGLLTTTPIDTTPSGPCCLTNNTGYTGMENQNYRVEIHQPGPLGTATFKWSRDNASVETAVTGILGVTNSVLASASQLTVTSMGRDQVLGFSKGNWIEIIDDDLELAGLPGELHLIDGVEFAGKTITLDSVVNSASFAVDGSNSTTASRHTRIRRWDQAGKILESENSTVYTSLAIGSGDITIPSGDISLLLEDGITVNFSASTGSFNTGDFWTFAARASTGTFTELNDAPPQGIHHHYTPLAIVDFNAQTTTPCRTEWSPGGEEPCGCCSVTVGDNNESFGQYTSIKTAISMLPAAGGEICILPGRYYEYVFLEGLSDVVIRGCGHHTRLASPSLAPNAPPPGSANSTDGTFTAVVSIANSSHIQLRDFCVEADTGDIGILIDGTGDLIASPPNNGTTIPGSGSPQADPATNAVSANPIDGERHANLFGTVDITVEDTFLIGSTMPALLAKSVELLHVDDNRVAMKNVRSLWPALWVLGEEMHIDRNFVGILSRATLEEWFPAVVENDLTQVAAKPSNSAEALVQSTGTVETKPTEAHATEANPVDVFSTASHIAKGFGGIQIAGPSRHVFVCDNIIVGGRFNGITLGSYDALDAQGNSIGATIGIDVVEESSCSTGGTLLPPTSVGSSSGNGSNTIVAGGTLVDIHIDRNRISSTGLCGIGPVGLFDLGTTAEVIAIEDLYITSNTVLDTVLRSTASYSAFGVIGADDSHSSSSGGNLSGSAGDTLEGASGALDSLVARASSPYAAICIPSVANLIVRDNIITNFGEQPGAPVSGIFVLNGELIEISRNQILETRDFDKEEVKRSGKSTSLFGGILVALVTPPSSAASGASGAFLQAVYAPGIPALRVQENLVRIPIGQALTAIGLGPFAISNNHFTCGGTVLGQGLEIAQTVLILNFGSGLEAAALASPSGLYTAGVDNYSTLNGAAAYASPFAPSANGTVLFTNNICQLEARADRQRSLSSLFILTLDHLIFSNNHCWLDTARYDSFLDAFLFAASLNVTSNRFQESPISVLFSGLTFGSLNITSQNISTFCLIVQAPTTGLKVDSANLAFIDAVVPGFCAALNKQ